MFELTLFKNQFDNKTDSTIEFSQWDKYVRWLYKTSKLEGKKGGDNSTPLITPAVFEEGTTRSNRTTDYWGSWCGIDVDDHDFGTDADDLRLVLEEKFKDFAFVCYSTASCRKGKLKFRLVFPLTGTVDKDRIKHFWFALNKELGDIGDPQTKDLARMYYLPAQYPNAYNFIFHSTGRKFIDPDEVMARHKYVQKTGNSFMDRLPPEMQKAVIEHRKSQLNNTNITWSTYSDCPFWPKSLAVEYMHIQGTGWYHKMYQIMIAIAGRAIDKGYPITANQIAEMCKQFDADTGNWYESRPLNVEADRALEYIYRKG